MYTKVNICGIEHTIKYVEDSFDCDMHFGQINFTTAEIMINKDMSEGIQKEALYHEIVHGILTHIGRSDLSDDEVLVQSLSNAMLQTFDIKNPQLLWIGNNGEIKEIRKEK